MNKIIKMLFSALLAFTMMFSNFVNVYAYDESTPRQFTRVKEIDYPWWWSAKIDSARRWSTVMCTYNGKYAYCLEASKNTPANGQYAAEVIDNNEAVRKLLYYGFGGPAQQTDYLKECLAAICPDDFGDKFGNADDGMYLLTHIWLSYFYCGDLMGLSIADFDAKWPGYGTGIINLGKALTELPEPAYARFTPGGKTASFTAEYDMDSHQQKTNTVKFDANANVTVNITLQDDVTLHNVTSGAQQTGGTATVSGGQSFYLTAPAKDTIKDYQSGDIAGGNCETFTALAIKTGSGTTQAQGSWDVDPDSRSLFYKVDWMDFGKLELTKYNDDQSATVPDTIYRITGPYGYDETHTTNEDGKICLENLLLGDYTVVETKAAEGYLINVTEKNFTVKANETVNVDFSNDEPTGRIELTKTIDTSKTDGKAGDAVLKGNTYELHAKEKITNKAGTKTFYQKDELVSSKKTDDNGQIVWDDLPVGEYYIQEVKANNSLVLNDKIIIISITYQGETVKKVLNEKKTTDRVNMQKIQVFKSGEKDSISGFVKGLQGATFTFKLKSEVDHVGWDNAQPYAIITTDTDGKASTPYLPYGTYLVKETKTPDDYITAPDFTVSITDDYSEYEDVEQVKRININNRPFTSQVKLVKVDKDTGKTITLNSASFKIKDSKGNYVTQKVAGVKSDTFTTNSKNEVIVKDGKNGEVTLPLELDAGTYTVEEIKTPEGFLELEEPVQFTITNVHDYDRDEDNDPILTVKVKNDKPSGKVVIKKTDKVTSDPLEEVEFELTAKKDVISPVDGSVIYAKGALVAKGKTNAEGIMMVDELPMGEYQLQETLTKEGYVLHEEVEDVIFKQEDTATKEYVINVNITNIAPAGEIHLVKTDGDTKQFLGGVTFQLTAKEDIYSLDGRNTLLYKAGDTVSMDISEEGRYVTNELGQINISDLPLGKYELKEIETLEGYVSNDKVYEIDLSYDHSDKIIYTENINIENEKTATEISKINATDEKELEGAHLSLKDKDGNIVAEWVSGKEAHIIRGLPVNEEYTLHEDLAPIGYATASDVSFKINDDGTATKVIMKDEIIQVEISKQDATTGAELEGASLKLTDKETGKTVEEWISGKTPHLIKGLEAQKTYILHESLAPLGYDIASDVEFTVADTGEVQKVVMKDERQPVTVQTGDDTDGMFYAGLVLLALAGMIIFMKRGKTDE